MRDRLATPFFPLCLRGLESSARELETPGVSARRLEGQIIGNGRFLLIEKTGHTATSARSLAKDRLGGIDVEIELHRDERRGIRVGRHDTSEHKALPALWRGALAGGRVGSDVDGDDATDWTDGPRARGRGLLPIAGG